MTAKLWLWHNFIDPLNVITHNYLNQRDGLLSFPSNFINWQGRGYDFMEIHVTEFFNCFMTLIYFYKHHKIKICKERFVKGHFEFMKQRV